MTTHTSDIPAVILPWIKNRTGINWDRDGFFDAVTTYFESLGCQVWLQPYTVDDVIHYNMVASLKAAAPEEGAQTMVFQAHYDTVSTTPGADDNWSGCLGVLTAAFVVSQMSGRISDTQFVLTGTEEPPFFGSSDMGSRIHAAWLEETLGLDAVEGVISFDCIGYYTDTLGWKDYFRGDAAALLALADHPEGSQFASLLVRGRSSRLLAEKVDFFHMPNVHLMTDTHRSPEVFITDLTGTRHEYIAEMSDHESYRELGFPALQVNDLAFCRPGSQMHRAGDDLSHISVPKILALAATVAHSAVS